MALNAIELSGLLSDLRMARCHMDKLAGQPHADAAIKRIDAAMARMSNERQLALAMQDFSAKMRRMFGFEPVAETL